MAAEQTAVELTTRDVLLQVDRRLTLIEEDLRGLDDKVETLDLRLSARIESLDLRLSAKLDDKVDGLSAKIDTKVDGLRGEMTGQINGLRGEMTGQINGLHGELGSLRIETNARFERVNTRIDEVYTKLDIKIDSKFYQLVGILLVTWISTIVTVLLK